MLRPDPGRYSLYYWAGLVRIPFETGQDWSEFWWEWGGLVRIILRVGRIRQNFLGVGEIDQNYFGNG